MQMSLYLTSTSIVGPQLPPWLEETCQRIVDNDESLQTVDLSHPRINDNLARSVAKALKENNIVTALILSCFAIVDDGAFALGSALGRNSGIEKLQLRDLRNQREINTFFQSLLENKQIQELSLRHSLICMRSIESVAALMKIHPRLQEVRLVDTQLVGGSFHHFCQGLEHSKTVQRLHLVNVELQEADAVEIAALISQDACCLDELVLSENELGDKGVATLIQHGVLQNKSLRVLDLRSNGVTAEGALSLQGLLVSSRNIVSLQLGNNELGDLGVSALARGLQAKKAGSVLQVLDLTNNGLTAGSCVSIGSMLRVNKSLTQLNLSFNKIGDDGARTLGLAMEVNTTLRWLSLRKNGISNAGAKSMAKMLPNMNGLKELILVKNDITHVGALALLDGLRENVELEYLHVVDEKQISQPVAREFIHWIRLNKAGRRIFRQPNEVHPSLWPHIYERVSADSDMIYYFLSENPDVLLGGTKC